MMRISRLVCVATAISATFALRVPPKGNHTAAAVHNHTAVVPTQAEVQDLHKKLEVMAGKMQKLVDSGVLRVSKIEPELKTFITELHAVLAQTLKMKDPAAAMRKLEAAKEGLAGLTAELTSRQETLMKEDDSEHDSLLLGVLMTRQKEPLEKQLEVLKNPDFVALPVAKALLAKHDDKSPLFAQAAAYLDKHTDKVTLSSALKSASSRKAEADAIANSFQKRVDTMQSSYDARSKQHAKRLTELKEAVEKVKTKKEKSLYHALLKREERNYKKWAASQKHDIDAMKAAVAALRVGDMKALDKAREALAESLRSLKGKNGGFLVLLSLGHQFMQRDCPYCAAQCVDKCHQEGKPYVACLTECADAGKGL